MDFLQPIDQGALYWFQSLQRPGLNEAVKQLTRLGDGPVLAFVALVLALSFVLARPPRWVGLVAAAILLPLSALAWRRHNGRLDQVVLLATVAFILFRRWRTAGLVAATALVAFLLSDTVKDVVKRPRPVITPALVPAPTTGSFPSSHALGCMAIYGGAALLACRRLRRRTPRILLAGGAVVLAMLIGLTRLYLGVHYLSDVLGGWTAGLACALLACWADQRLGAAEPTFRPAGEDQGPGRPWHAPPGAGGASPEGFTEGDQVRLK